MAGDAVGSVPVGDVASEVTGVEAAVVAFVSPVSADVVA